jgi:hypothetical protein
MSGAGTAQSEGLDSVADIQIDFWNMHLHNILWGFPHEIKELLCKFFFIDMCRLYIFIMTFTLLVHMPVLHEPFIP